MHWNSFRNNEDKANLNTIQRNMRLMSHKKHIQRKIAAGMRLVCRNFENIYPRNEDIILKEDFKYHENEDDSKDNIYNTFGSVSAVTVNIKDTKKLFIILSGLKFKPTAAPNYVSKCKEIGLYCNLSTPTLYEMDLIAMNTLWLRRPLNLNHLMNPVALLKTVAHLDISRTNFADNYHCQNKMKMWTAIYIPVIDKRYYSKYSLSNGVIKTKPTFSTKQLSLNINGQTANINIVLCGIYYQHFVCLEIFPLSRCQDIHEIVCGINPKLLNCIRNVQ